MNNGKKSRAILLLSGGLDSTLVGAILKRENIEVLAIKFVTGLEYAVIKNELMQIDEDDPALKTAKKLDIPIRYVSLKDQYLDMFLNPKYGYGSAINPCLDCHILMLKNAKEIMEKEGFDFVATGEVKWQRPMSQKSRDLDKAAKESGLNGYLLRPLSAKLLPETIPEKKGLIKRENLYGIQGRGRNIQIKLAEELCVEEYPSPSGSGCSIVDKGYAKRYFDFIKYQTKDIVTMEILKYMAIGRHIRLSEKTKLILGRNEKENDALEKRERKNAVVLKPNYSKGPFGFIEVYGDIEDEIIHKAAVIIAHHSKEPVEIFSITSTDYQGKTKTFNINKDEIKQVTFEQIV